MSSFNPQGFSVGAGMMVAGVAVSAASALHAYCRDIADARATDAAVQSWADRIDDLMQKNGVLRSAVQTLNARSVRQQREIAMLRAELATAQARAGLL